jgi:hypothetical protein
MPPITASVDVELSAARPAGDLVKLRLDLGETKTGLLGRIPRSSPHRFGTDAE